jgi:hypothetical protein
MRLGVPIVGVVALLAGCTATVEGPGGGGPGNGAAATPGGGATSGGGGASGASGASGGSSATGGTAATAGVGGAGAGVNATDPGRVTMHRLNRAEYNNTVRDLLGTSQKPADDFPIDDRGSGFDNLADVLTLSPLHLDLYYKAAETLVTEALASPTQRARIVSCDLASGGEACARTSLTDFARRAWRRPVTDAEVNGMMATVAVAVAQGDGYERGVALAARAVLLSPHFIFRVEIDPDPTSLTPHALSGYELASRLSYFLWSSMPDEALFSAAAGSLADPATLASEMTRMLADGKAQAIIENFAGQWLYLRAVDTVEPDPGLFRSFDASLRTAMKSETALLFADVAFGNLPANQLLTADYTYLNDRLATHYGLPAVGGSQMVRTSLAGNAQRGGLLSHASFLTHTSHPNRTSPVKRGKWVLDEMLCSTVPPPDPNLDMAGAEADIAAGLSQREVLERHRADTACAGCHSMMDPIGLGFENYDAIGAYRTMDRTNVIDAAGDLEGVPFTGPKELAALLAADPDFARCMTEKLYTYALGRAPDRAPEHLDGPMLVALAARLSEAGYSFTELVAGIVTSPTFLNRRGDPATGM